MPAAAAIGSSCGSPVCPHGTAPGELRGPVGSSGVRHVHGGHWVFCSPKSMQWEGEGGGHFGVLFK